MLKEYICNCENPYLEGLSLDEGESFNDWLDKKESIDLQEFVASCDLSKELLREIIKFPNDYKYYKIGGVYFYCWSCIEYFYR